VTASARSFLKIFFEEAEAARWSPSKQSFANMLDNYIDAADMNGREGITELNL
jgi:hypothetical protein